MIPDIPLRQNEEVIRSAEHVTIKAGRFHLVLPNQRVVVVNAETGRPADVLLGDILSAETGRSPAGAPALVIGALSTNRQARTLVLAFSPAGHGPRDQERDLWLSDIAALIRQRTAPPPQQPAPQPVFCSRCGRQAPPGAAFCDRCGSPLIIPEPLREPARELPQKPAPGPVRVPARPRSSTTVTVTRKYGDIPLVSPEVQAAKTAPAPRRAPEKRPSTREWGKRRIAVAAGIVVVVIAALLLFTTPGLIPDFSSLLNTSGNATPATTTPAATSVPVTQRETVTVAKSAPASVPEEEPTDAGEVSSSDPPEFMFDEYMYYYQIGDTAAMYSLLSESVKSTTTEEQVTDTVVAELDEGTAYGGYTIINSDVSDASAVLVLETTWEIGGEVTTRTETIPFVREDGQWKLNSFVSASQIG
jgi:hypothetical protein